MATALKKGESLANPNLWSKRANLTAILIIFIQGCLLISKSFGYEFMIDQMQIQQIADIISTIGVALVAVIHTASNKEAGHG